jgi:hypothetical protein
MKKEKPMGLLLNGSVKKSGVTFYLKQGQMIVRPSHSIERRSCTRQQFVQRQRMRHSIALWQQLSICQPLFTQRKTAYGNFIALANRLPAVFVPCNGPLDGASFLMPDMPVSDGSLPPIKQQLGSVAGTAALLTNLDASDLRRSEKLLLYTAEQRIEGGKPVALFLQVREVAKEEFVELTPADSSRCLALTGDEFADTMRGWTLVRVIPSATPGEVRCSTQSLVTHCRLYEQYTTEEALRQAAESYGGLTE